MQTLNVSASRSDAPHPGKMLRLSANDADCNVVIALPMQAARTSTVVLAARDAVAPRGSDDYVLGGYAGICPHSPIPYRCVSPKAGAIPEPSR